MNEQEMPQPEKTVAELRQSGFKVSVRHSRYTTKVQKNGRKRPGQLLPMAEIPGNERFPKGGRTEVRVTTPEGKNYQTTVNCINTDSWHRKMGLNLALTRVFDEKNEVPAV